MTITASPPPGCVLKIPTLPQKTAKNDVIMAKKKQKERPSSTLIRRVKKSLSRLERTIPLTPTLAELDVLSKQGILMALATNWELMNQAEPSIDEFKYTDENGAEQTNYNAYLSKCSMIQKMRSQAVQAEIQFGKLIAQREHNEKEQGGVQVYIDSSLLVGQDVNPLPAHTQNTAVPAHPAVLHLRNGSE